eukprot:11653248-Ditylum_brightwellii.AAC.1
MMKRCQQCPVRYVKGQSGSSTAVTNEKMVQTSPYLSKEVNWPRSNFYDSQLSKESSIISTSKLLQDPKAVGTNLNNGVSSGQSRTSSGQSSTVAGKPTSIDTTLHMASNTGHGARPKKSYASAPPGTHGTEIMVLPHQRGYLMCSRICVPKIFIYNVLMEGNFLNVMQQFMEETGPFAYGRVVGVPNTKKEIDYFTIEYDKAELQENKSCELYTTKVPGIKLI